MSKHLCKINQDMSKMRTRRELKRCIGSDLEHPLLPLTATLFAFFSVSNLAGLNLAVLISALFCIFSVFEFSLFLTLFWVEFGCFVVVFLCGVPGSGSLVLVP